MALSPKIVMVNYLNSKPFEYGLRNSPEVANLEIILETPAACASIFEDNAADVALIPVGALHGLDNYKIISDYCIGCDGDVRTVCIFSNQDINNCQRLYLDNHSRTSFLLAKVLMKEYYQLDIPFYSLDINTYVHREGDAVLMIGDKVFDYEKQFLYSYDLGHIWKIWTGLPFVFAVWVADKNFPADIENDLNTAFKNGISHLPEIIKKESHEGMDLYYYFSHNIQYVLDDPKKEALNLFLEKSKKYYLHHADNVQK